MIPQGVSRSPQGTARVPQGVFRVPQGTQRIPVNPPALTPFISQQAFCGIGDSRMAFAVMRAMIQWVNVHSGGRLCMGPGYNQGISSATLSDLYTGAVGGRGIAVILAVMAKIWWLDGGINDLGAGATGATCLTRRKAIRDAIWAQDPTARIIETTVFPNVTIAGGSGAEYNEWVIFTAGLMALQGTDPRLRIVDVHTGYNNATMNFDGLHPNAIGARFVGSRVATALIALYDVAFNPVTDFDVGNVFPDTAMTGSAAAGTNCTGNVPTNYTLTATAFGITPAASVAAQTLTYNGVSYQCTTIDAVGTASGAGSWTLTHPITGANTGLTTFFRGINMESGGIIQVTATDGVSDPVGFYCFGGQWGSNGQFMATSNDASGGLSPAKIDPTFMRSTAGYPTADLTTQSYSWIAGFIAGAVDVRIKIAHPTFRKAPRELVAYGTPTKVGGQMLLSRNSPAVGLNEQFTAISLVAGGGTTVTSVWTDVDATTLAFVKNAAGADPTVQNYVAVAGDQTYKFVGKVTWANSFGSVTDSTPATTNAVT
jgi:lysophospholipase L1-like esterase